jgi:hypothetical protein
MKKTIQLLLIGLTTLFFTACGGSSSTHSSVEVNLIGIWDTQIAMQNSICDGLLAGGIEIIEGLDGSNTTIGNIIVDGTDFALDSYRNCYLAPRYKIDTSARGIGSIMTEDEFLNWIKYRSSGISTIRSIKIINFNHNIISVKYERTDNVIIHQDLIRR